MTDQQLCIWGLFILAVVSLAGAGFVEDSNQGTMITMASNVVSGILGYLTGKE